MIQELDKTLEKLMYDKGRLNRNDVDISFEQPNGDWSSRISRPTLNIWCFDIQENLKMRTMAPRMVPELTMGVRKFPPIRLDLTYLITAWARKVEDEHQLLWRALGALAQIPELDPATCEGTLKEQAYNIPVLVANMPTGMPNMSDLWSVLNNQMRLGFTAVITLALERTTTFDSPLVLETDIRIGVSSEPELRQIDIMDVELRERHDLPDGTNGDNGAAEGGSAKKKRK